MRALAAGYALLCTSTLAPALAGTCPFYAPLSASLLGALWATLLATRPQHAPSGLFLVLTLGGCGLAAVRGAEALSLLAATGALFAWDAATMRRVLVSLPPSPRRRAAARYATQSLATASAALAIPLLGSLLRPALGFPVALGLSLALLTLLALALWQSRRASEAPEQPATTADADEGGEERAEKESADDA